LDVTANDDLGIFDPCDSDTLSGTKNGSLSMLSDCSWFYLPNPGFSGKDTFYYILNFLDTCVLQCYCDSDPGCADGKIWTINSIYLGDEEGDVIVRDKNGNEMATFSDLTFGDFFFVDGSDGANSNVNWTFEQYVDGQLTSSQSVHTSCSQEIFGVLFDFFRPISGCVAPPPEKEGCRGVGSFNNDPQMASSRAVVPITAAGADTTIVIITVEAPLAIEFAKFSANKLNEEYVIIEWAFDIEVTPAKIELEKSFDSRNFETVLMYRTSERTTKDAYKDYNVNNGLFYYRLKITESDGNISYSKIISISVGGEGKKLVSVYPNPGKGNFQVETNNYVESLGWNILDHSGRVIARQSDGNAESLERVLNGLSNGIYILETYNAIQRISLQKLVVL
jgi:hypothetical protein